MKKREKQLNGNAFRSWTELAGEFSIRIPPSPGHSLAESYQSVQEAMKTFETRGVTDDDIAKFKGLNESQTINSLQSVSGKIFQLANFQTLAGNPNMIGTLLDSYNAVKKEDVLAVYNRYIKGKPSVILSVTVKGKEKNIAAADNYKIDQTHYSAPEYGYIGLHYSKPKDQFDRPKIPGNGSNPVIKVPPFCKKELADATYVI